MANASVFRIDWEDLQLNMPDLTSPAQFYIANVGGATSSGVEFELNARVHPSVDVFGGVGYTRARFADGSVSSGVPVGGNKIPNTPEYTATLGTQVSHPLRPGISRLRTGGGGVLRRLRVRRPEPGGSGRLLARQLPGRRARAVSCSPRRGSATRSTRATSRSRLPTARWRRQDSSARWAGRGRSGSARASRSERPKAQELMYERDELASSSFAIAARRRQRVIARAQSPSHSTGRSGAGPIATACRRRPGLLAQWPRSGPPVAWSAAMLGAGYGSIAVQRRPRLRAGHAQSPERRVEPQSRRRQAGLGPQSSVRPATTIAAPVRAARRPLTATASTC